MVRLLMDFMEGARWDVGAQIIDKSQPKEMYVAMPIITCRAVPADKVESSGIFMCPVYKTQFRGPTYVFSAQLKNKISTSEMGTCKLCVDLGCRSLENNFSFKKREREREKGCIKEKKKRMDFKIFIERERM